MDESPRPYLIYLQGSEITTEAKPKHALPLQTWVIDKHLEEDTLRMTQPEHDRGLGAANTAAKFLCHRKDDPTGKPAFMRIYHQIPIMDTEYSDSVTRSSQACAGQDFTELSALIKLKELNCQVTPALLGYQHRKQGPGDIIPGGFSTCVVWDKVPGESLTPQYFWILTREARDTIRREFRQVFERQFLPCGVEPAIPTSTNIIYDELSGSIHISGFCPAAFMDPTREWTDNIYALYRLAKCPRPIPGTRNYTEWEF